MESEKELEKTKRSKTIKGKSFLAAMLALALLMAAVSAAWYVINSQREINSISADIMTPYFLYLLNPDDEEALSLTIANIHPGEVKQAVICVSNKNPDSDGTSEYDISKDSSFSYELELAYTENLPVEYNIYQLYQLSEEEKENLNDPERQKVVAVTDEYGEEQMYFIKVSADPLDAEDVSESRRKEMYGEDQEGIVNLGTYELYKTDNAGDYLQLATSVDAADETEYEKDYYLIEIIWPDDKSFSDYQKETDLVYVIVKALQPRPEEKETN